MIQLLTSTLSFLKTKNTVSLPKTSMVRIKLSKLHNNNFNQDKCLALKIKKINTTFNILIRGLCNVIMKVLVDNSNTVIIIIYFTKVFF